MATTFSEVHTLSVGVNTIVLGLGGNAPSAPVVPFGVAPGFCTHNYLKLVKHSDTFNAPAEIWIDLAGGTATQNGAGQESVPELAAESALMSASGAETRSRITAAGELEISVWSSGAGDVTIEGVH